ncbi:MAG TPA: VOC family protein [Acidimicrobiales bacterium]|nr:VOC family protein [Acidimicrobiales bacterium]
MSLDGRPLAHRVVGLDHVQLAMPPGAEREAEEFYCGLLGFEVLDKPPALAARGGRWFGARGGSVQVHLGVEDGFRPARKAHPALAVEGLDELVGRLRVAGRPVRFDGDNPGVRRCYTEDPFGNRIELVDAGS